ncbi:hypothetical protein HGRIS_008734 [Hohenbuehelia grisea]|uniref:Uncharacterized protein n=1 Tax=Hohenbuehelia grisea TaxID=104357 RepID=A0ABR3J975_9AGAR
MVGAYGRKYHSVAGPYSVVEPAGGFSDWSPSSSVNSTPACSMPATPFDMPISLPSTKASNMKSNMRDITSGFQALSFSNAYDVEARSMLNVPNIHHALVV